MLKIAQKNIKNTLIKQRIKKILELMGFGHRVYKNYDPRAKFKRICQKVLKHVGLKNDPILNLQ